MSDATTLSAEKVAIALSRDKNGKFTVQVLGIHGDRVISSLTELEEAGVGIATASRAVERIWKTLRLRLNRGLIEFTNNERTDEQTNDDERIRNSGDSVVR